MTLANLKSKCPGLYCGRQFTDSINGSIPWSDCGACPRGYRVSIMSDFSECMPCENNPSTYDWLYLGFMAMLPLILHWFFIDLAAKERCFTKGEIILHISAFFEVLTSAIVTLLIYEPYWTLKIHSCAVARLSDWYTLFHNPTPNYDKKLYCTQEAVYPLQTMVLVFYLLCIILMMLVRPILNVYFLKNGKMAVYSALYFIPILALLHTIIGGLMYYAFPYLSIIISMISNAAHFSMKLDQSMKALFVSSITETKNCIIIVGHWLILAYGIMSLTVSNAILLVMVPLPALFYIFTVKFTDPSEFRERDERNH
ncbi:JNK1/MAPK8-associated membrane protein [Sitodiplosis mosellana]|uniref:JNK1/MAPK8-associated membrane protein n=1 Tax=Sitodiplosis mosellana TaxID=263140 RepID=UPI002443D7A0|nr:JNK1/MAPK8-associated membrane protein [Sitodiplosis mosellana]